MKNIELINKSSNLRQCKYCKGRDGKSKAVYETIELAYDALKFIGKERGIYLNIYPCPNGNGWHLTKNNEIENRNIKKSIILQNNNIPLSSLDDSWEYLEDTVDDLNVYNEIVDNKKNNKYLDIPILKIECKSESNIIELSGKIMEIIENINIEKIFGINTDNLFYKKIIKNNLDGNVNQITVFVKNDERNQLDSYTILIEEKLLKKYKLKKGNQIKISIMGISINNLTKWCCNNIIR